jgi:hypothetical protein
MAHYYMLSGLSISPPEARVLPPGAASSTCSQQADFPKCAVFEVLFKVLGTSLKLI